MTTNENEEEQLQEIDNILAEEEPDFVNSLTEIKADALNNQEIAQFNPDAEVKYNRFRVFWRGLEDGPKKIIVFGGFICLVAIPVMLVSVFGVLTPNFETQEKTSLAMWADEVIDTEQTTPEKDLRHLFHTPEFLLDIPEQVFHLKPKRNVRFGRFSFYVQLSSKEDLNSLQPRGDEIIETLSRTLKTLDVDDFQGVEGKEAVRHILLAALVKDFGKRVVNIRYRLLVFN